MNNGDDYIGNNKNNCKSGKEMEENEEIKISHAEAVGSEVSSEEEGSLPLTQDNNEVKSMVTNIFNTFGEAVQQNVCTSTSSSVVDMSLGIVGLREKERAERGDHSKLPLPIAHSPSRVRNSQSMTELVLELEVQSPKRTCAKPSSSSSSAIKASNKKSKSLSFPFCKIISTAMESSLGKRLLSHESRSLSDSSATTNEEQSENLSQEVF